MIVFLCSFGMDFFSSNSFLSPTGVVCVSFFLIVMRLRLFLFNNSSMFVRSLTTFAYLRRSLFNSCCIIVFVVVGKPAAYFAV